MTTGSSLRAVHRSWLGLPALAVLIAVLVLSGCGSSKPSYCTDLANLETSVHDLTQVNVVQTGVSGVKSALGKVQVDAAALATSAKSAFPGETSDIDQSIDALKKSLGELSSSQSRASAVVAIAGELSTLGSAVSSLKQAATKC